MKLLDKKPNVHNIFFITSVIQLWTALLLANQNIGTDKIHQIYMVP